LLVKYKPTIRAADVESSLAKIKAKKIKQIEKLDVFRIQLPKELKVGDALSTLTVDPNIEFVEPNYIYQLDVIPNDPRFSELWGLHNTGQTGGTADADIDAPEAWDLEQGDPDVIVAVTDTGVDYNHEDLRDNMWVNTGETPGDNIDNDGNGYRDDIHGYDFIDNDSDPMDYHNHGTHVAGTIGAVGNNNIGVVGVNWNTRIMALKIFKPLECGGVQVGNISNAADSAEAIIYAAMNNAKVINASWGGTRESLTIKTAIEFANLRSVLFVAAAGNDGTDNDTAPHYPANYGAPPHNLPNVIAVAATDHNDDLATFPGGKGSNFGDVSVHLGAPGKDILSTVIGDDYKKFMGTSMASPHVAGVAALVWAHHPGKTLSQVKNCILNHVDVKPALTNKVRTDGRLNASKSVRCNPSAQHSTDKPVVSAVQNFNIPKNIGYSGQLKLKYYSHFKTIGSYFVLLVLPIGFIFGWKINIHRKSVMHAKKKKDNV
jgi:subtilisin family serine protease